MCSDRFAPSSASVQRGTVLLAYWLISAGTISMQYAFSAIYVEALESLDGSATLAALVGSLCTALEDGLGAVSGPVAQRIGSRACCIIGGLLVALGLCTSALVENVWQLLLTYSLLVGIGCSLSLFAAVMCIGQWFDRSLAKAHGLAKTGASVGPFVLGGAAPALFRALGWRGALLLLGGADGAMLILAGFLLRPPPLTAAAPPAVAKPAAAPDPSSASLREIMRLRRVQLMCGCTFFFGFGSWINVVHIVKIGLESGLSEAAASRLLIYVASGSLVMRVPSGAIADYVGRRGTLAAFLALYALVDAVAAVDAPRRAAPFLAFHGFSIGWLSGGVLSILPALPFEQLPPRYRRVASAAIFTPFGVGVLTGPSVAASMQGASGSYSSAIALASASLGAAACLALSLGPRVPRAARQGDPAAFDTASTTHDERADPGECPADMQAPDRGACVKVLQV